MRRVLILKINLIGKIGLMAKDEITNKIIAAVSNITGFPTDSLNSGQKLLDDLNMDSIKAGELINMLSGQLNVELEVGEFMNASIDEIASYIVKNKK